MLYMFRKFDGSVWIIDIVCGAVYKIVGFYISFI